MFKIGKSFRGLFSVKKGSSNSSRFSEETWFVDFEVRTISVGEQRYPMSDRLWSLLRHHCKDQEVSFRLFSHFDEVGKYWTLLGSEIAEFPNDERYVHLYFSAVLHPAYEEMNPPSLENKRSMTRDCVDPWTYMEITTEGGRKPCCKLPALSHISESDSDVASYSMRTLKGSLLSGNLYEGCRGCHIRRRTTTAALQKRIGLLQYKHNGKEHLASLPLQTIRIDVTGRCNLRCVYCQVSNPNYEAFEMEKSVFESAIPYVQNASPDCEIHINGHGETTFHPKWMELAQDVLDLGRRPCIITNLAKQFSQQEIDILAQFKKIQVSLDSHEERLMRQIRKAVSPEHIFAQIERIRLSATRQELFPEPQFSFSVGVYDPSIDSMPEFIERLVTLQPESVTFWNLVKYEHNKLAIPISLFSDEQTKCAREKMQSAVLVLKGNRVPYHLAGDFLASDGLPLLR